jgi:hypothetical protein
LNSRHKKDLNGGEWEVVTPETAAEFTAVGYFFARHLKNELDVPIGLLNSSWGGSQVESWISGDAIKSSEVLGYYAETMPKSWDEDGIISVGFTNLVEQELKVELFDFNGKLMEDLTTSEVFKVGVSEIAVNTKNLSNGTYYVIIQGEPNTTYHRLLIAD